MSDSFREICNSEYGRVLPLPSGGVYVRRKPNFPVRLSEQPFGPETNWQSQPV